jgi:hypothetical protein
VRSSTIGTGQPFFESMILMQHGSAAFDHFGKQIQSTNRIEYQIARMPLALASKE